MEKNIARFNHSNNGSNKWRSFNIVSCYGNKTASKIVIESKNKTQLHALLIVKMAGIVKVLNPPVLKGNKATYQYEFCNGEVFSDVEPCTSLTASLYCKDRKFDA